MEPTAITCSITEQGRERHKMLVGEANKQTNKDRGFPGGSGGKESALNAGDP